jgi:polysaccharide export outer membrane protein
MGYAPRRPQRIKLYQCAFFLLFLAAASLAGCGTRGPAAFNSSATDGPGPVPDAPRRGQEAGAYRIGPSDKLSVYCVFQVEDLSFEEIFRRRLRQAPAAVAGVRPGGRIDARRALDRSREEAGREIPSQSPRVSVSVSEAASQKITVDGAVMKPGVYEMRGRTSLAAGRRHGGGRHTHRRPEEASRCSEPSRAGGMIAVFDLAAIRRGQAADPVKCWATISSSSIRPA